MGHILVVTSSAAGEASQSRALALEFAGLRKASRPGAVVVERALPPETTPHVSMDLMSALAMPASQHTRAQQAALALSDTLVAEVEAADTIVIASPMYAFSVSSTLKAWLELINRAGRTFTAPGHDAPPVGLITGREVVVVCTRGGILSGAPLAAMDHQAPLLRSVLGFFGMAPKFILVEGLAHEHAQEAFEAGRAAIAKLAGETA